MQHSMESNFLSNKESGSPSVLLSHTVYPSLRRRSGLGSAEAGLVVYSRKVNPLHKVFSAALPSDQ